MAVTLPKIPHPSAELVDPTDRITRQWLIWFEDLQKAIEQRLSLAGTASLNGVASVAVTLVTPELNANYNVVIDVPDAARTAYVAAASKTVNGFTISLNGGNGSSALYGWTIVRR